MKRINLNKLLGNRCMLVLASTLLSLLLLNSKAFAGPAPAASLTFTISSGTSWVVSGSMQVVCNKANYTNNGSATYAASSKVVLAGSGNYTIAGTDTFANLEIQGNYSVGASASDKLFVTGKLTKTSGTLVTSDKLTLISNAAGTALIQENGGNLTGKAYIQHYAGGNFGYHQFSSPVSDATVNSWSNAFPIFGPDGAPGWSSNWGSLQYYDEVANTSAWLDSGYYNYTSLSNALTPGQGLQPG